MTTAPVLAMQLAMGALFGIIGLALADPMPAMPKVLLERQSAKGRSGDAGTGADPAPR